MPKDKAITEKPVGRSLVSLTSHHPDNTRQLGNDIGRLAEKGDIFLLTGKLGAGKTCLTQGIANGLGIEEYTLSPSFVIMRELHGRLPLYHIDLFRLHDLVEVADLGLDDYLYGRGTCAVEWAERAFELLPPQHLLIEIKYLAGDKRRLKLKAKGQRYRQMVTNLEKIYKESGYGEKRCIWP